MSATIPTTPIIQRSPITTHILDTSTGRPAAYVSVTLERELYQSQWKMMGQGHTNEDGRINNILPPGSKAEAGTYRMTFDTKPYYKDSSTFYPYIIIVFEIKNPGEHYHVPLLLSPYGYSTYRGS
jgi:5-hydroxyisourate hydrolase